MSFIVNEKYKELLLKNAEMSRLNQVNTPEQKKKKKELTKIEVVMSSSDIIKHAEICFPHVSK